jgi:poly-D-alanine transfer protein DltD
MIVYVNGRGMNAPELKAYISELEAENAELRAKVESDNRQIAEYKRLLKAAVEDFAVYGALKDLSAKQRVQNPDWRRFNRVFDALSHQWCYADEALALIGEEGERNG